MQDCRGTLQSHNNSEEDSEKNWTAQVISGFPLSSRNAACISTAGLVAVITGQLGKKHKADLDGSWSM